MNPTLEPPGRTSHPEAAPIPTSATPVQAAAPSANHVPAVAPAPGPAPLSVAPEVLPHRADDRLHAWLRRSWIIVLTGLAGALIGLYVFRASPPVFESRATIDIKRFKRDAAEFSEDEKVRLTGMGEIASIVEKLRMRPLYQAAAENRLFQNREGLVPARRELRAPWKADTDTAGRAAAEKVSPAALAGMMRGWVSVSWRENTTLIDLKARHTEPQVARDALQALVEEYERLTDQSVEGSSENTLGYIMSTAAEVKEAVLETETDLQRYARCIELSTEIEAAQRSVIELEKRYLERWPALVESKKLVGILREDFSREFGQVFRHSAKENEFWNQSESNLATFDADELIDVRLRFVKSRANVLQKDLESDRVLYDSLMAKLKEGQINQGYVTKHFELVEAPRLPGGPVAPVQSMMVRNGLAGGVALGFAIVFGMGFLDRCVQSVGQLESRFSVPVIGAFAALRGGRRGTSRPLVMAGAEGDDVDKEAFRALRASITLLNPEVQPRSLLISSSLPGEGKSWIAANLSIAFACQGERTILIDADLRKPVQTDIFGISRDAFGLTDLLAGRCGNDEAFHRVVPDLDNLLVLPAGTKCENPSEFLASKEVRNLLTSLAVDRVIIDSAPLLPVADTLPLAHASDAVFLVCHVGKTPIGAVEKGWQLLETNGNNTPSGLIANRLKRRSRKGGYYSYQGGYSYGYGYGS